MMTRNVQFHSTDEFKRIEDMRAAFPTNEVRINKRIRSLARWKKAAIAAGLRVKLVVRTFNVPEIVTPENNVMILERPRAGRADPSSA